MSQINEKVVEIIVEKLNCEASEVTPEANFSSDLGADSLDTVELIMEFEKAFDIQIPRSGRSDDQDGRRRYQLHRKQEGLIALSSR